MDLGLVLIGVAAFAAAVAVLYALITRLTRAAFGPRRRLEGARAGGARATPGAG